MRKCVNNSKDKKIGLQCQNTEVACYDCAVVQRGQSQVTPAGEPKVPERTCVIQMGHTLGPEMRDTTGGARICSCQWLRGDL